MTSVKIITPTLPTNISTFVKRATKEMLDLKFAEAITVEKGTILLDSL